MTTRLALPVAGVGPTDRRISVDERIGHLLAENAPVAFGLSGGKDSHALAVAGIRYLNERRHTGPRLFVHADLGEVEWADSLPTCERIAKSLGVELLKVRRGRGGMMDRWEQRWDSNVRRWEELECVKLILPWSTPSMRFCTSELKVDPICQALSRRWPGRTIVNATGIRAEESRDRANAPVSAEQKKLTSKTRRTSGVSWNPLLTWSVADVWRTIAESGIDPHEAYGRFGTSRVSCVVCIIVTVSDHRAAVADRRNHPVLRRMAALEVRSTFAFQGSRWLVDTIDELMTDDQRAIRDVAKARAKSREQIESRIPRHLWYTRGWPTSVPSPGDADLLAGVRRDLGQLIGLRPEYLTGRDVRARYRELMALRDERASRRRP